MQRAPIQRGGINLDVSPNGKKSWVFRWRETQPDGRRVQRKRVIGALDKYPTRKAAENAARAFRLVRPGADAGQAQGAGKSGRDAQGQGKKHGLNGFDVCVHSVSIAENAVIGKCFQMLASPTGFEPVLPP
jgi:hypothetical protein